MNIQRIRNSERLPSPVSEKRPEKGKSFAPPGDAPLPQSVPGKLSRRMLGAHIRQLVSLLDKRLPVQASLFPLLRIFEQLSPDSRDARLLILVLGRWADSHSGELSPKIHEQLRELEHSFSSVGVHKEEAGDALLFQEKPDIPGQRPSFSIRLRENHHRRKKEINEGSSLILEMALPFLGGLEVAVGRAGNRLRCRISCDNKKTVVRIRKALPEFKREIARKTGFVSSISVKENLSLFSTLPAPLGEEGLNLWG